MWISESTVESQTGYWPPIWRSLYHSFQFIFGFSPCIFKVSHFYWPINAPNCIKLKI